MVLEGFTSAPLLYIDRAGNRHDLSEQEDCSLEIMPQQVICDIRSGRWANFRPSQTAVSLPVHLQDTVNRIVEDRKFRQTESGLLLPESPLPAPPLASNQTPTPDPPEEEADMSSKKPPANRPRCFVRSGKMTDEGREYIRACARKGLSTDEIARLVPDSVPRQTIVATRAVANRKKR
jgi:hypothetical protein